MDKKIVIEIEGKRYPTLLTLDKASRGKLSLTTISDLQTRAIVKIFLFEQSTEILIKQIEVKNIPPKEAGHPEIDLFGDFDGKRYLSLKFILNGKTYLRIDINIRKFLVRRKKTWIFIPLILFLLLPLLYFGLRGKSFKRTSFEDTAAGISLRSEKMPEQTAEIPREMKEEEKKGPVKVASEPREDTSVQEVFEKETVFFQPDSSHLSSAILEKLNRILPFLKENPNLRVTISGHCALYGTEKGRIRLSTKRASRVYQYLKNNGWKPRIEPRVIGFGAKKPLTTHIKDDHLNRRVEIHSEE